MTCMSCSYREMETVWFSLTIQSNNDVTCYLSLTSWCMPSLFCLPFSSVAVLPDFVHWVSTGTWFVVEASQDLCTVSVCVYVSVCVSFPFKILSENPVSIVVFSLSLSLSLSLSHTQIQNR